MNRPADVSLVFETANDRPDRRIRFADVVEAWKRQTRADRVLEWLVVYLPGLFSREMALAQLGDQTDQPHDTTHFLAHNVLLRAEAVRATGLFRGDTIRLGSDSDLAGRLIEAGYRLRYEPALGAMHHYSRRWTNLYRSCADTGYSYGRFQQYVGGPHPNRLWDFAGRMRVLLARWRQSRRSLGLPLWRFPISLLFFVMYSVAVAHGYELAVRGKPKPTAKR